MTLKDTPRPDEAAARTGPDETRAAIDRLVVAAGGLARTIAVTEELALQRAAILARGANRGLARNALARNRDVISLAEAARRSGRHQEVLRRWCVANKIPAVRVGRTWGITEETLATLIEHSARSRPRLSRADRRVTR